MIELKPQFFIKAPRSLVKPYYEDKVVWKPTEFLYHKRTEPDDEAMPDKGISEKILDHKEDRGKVNFLTK